MSSDHGRSMVRCPRCKQSSSLWEGVEVAGWRSLEADGTPSKRNGRLDREVDWDHAAPDGYVGCGECQWEGARADLERLGWDGEPLPKINPRQEKLV
jgi:hypothetical protein